MKNLVESWINLYLEQKYKIQEMADDLQSIKKDIKDSRLQLLTHLVKIYFWSDVTTDYNHWKGEVFSFLNHMPLIKGKNKYPNYKQLMNWGFQTSLESIRDQLSIYVKRAYNDENKPESIKRRKGVKLEIPKYDENKLKQFMSEYINWLCEELSNPLNKGVADEDKIYDRIDKLYDKYCKYKNSN